MAMAQWWSLEAAFILRTRRHLDLPGHVEAERFHVWMCRRSWSGDMFQHRMRLNCTKQIVDGWTD